MVRTFNLEFDNRFLAKSTSKGNQKKWVFSDIFVKADSMGYESIAEVLCAELLKYTGLYYADYFFCNIKEAAESDVFCFDGCYSYNFTKEDESFISFYRLLDNKYSEEQYNKEYKKLNGKELMKKMIADIEDITGLDTTNYVSSILLFDGIVLNEDRHLNNLGVIKTSSGYREAPVFDNGLSLLSDTRDYGIDEPIAKCMKRIKAKPFSSSFEKQITYAENMLTIDYSGFLENIKNLEVPFKQKEYERALRILEVRMEKLEGKAWKQE
jgi:hypothetical protein